MPSRDTLRETVLRLLGPELAGALGDGEVTEIFRVEGDGRVWLDGGEAGRRPGSVEMPVARVEMLLNAVATATGMDFGPGRPALSAELPDGLGRLTGFMPPMTPEPVFVLRKPSPRVRSLDELVARGFLPDELAHRLRWMLVDQRTLLVVGGTGTGKTTFLNTLLAELADLCPEQRIAILEDTPELVPSSRDLVRLWTVPGYDLYTLLDLVLRASPHRIVVGEVRDHAALAMLDAWNTGHPGGLATLHANTCQDALLRLGTLVQRAGVPPQNELIGATVSHIVRLAGTHVRTRHVAEMADVEGYDTASGRWIVHPVYERTA